MSDLRRVAGPALLAAAVSILSLPSARAEVGVARGGSGPLRLYLVSLVDDPEPIDGMVWSRHNPESQARAVLNDGGAANGDGNPSMLVTPDWVPLVAWARNSPQGYDVVLSRFESGAWTAPEVLAGSAHHEYDPHLFLDPSDQSVHLVYWIDEPTPRVMHRKAPADLSSWTAALQISQPGQAACRPTGVFHNGVMKVVYEVHDFGIGSSPRQIVLATQSGQQFLAQMVSLTHHDHPNWPQVHSANGRLWIDWIDAGGEMAWSLQLSAGWGAVQIEEFESAEERDFHVRGKIKSLVLD